MAITLTHETELLYLILTVFELLCVEDVSVSAYTAAPLVILESLGMQNLVFRGYSGRQSIVAGHSYRLDYLRMLYY
jgi:hypothetical protein